MACCCTSFSYFFVPNSWDLMNCPDMATMRACGFIFFYFFYFFFSFYSSKCVCVWIDQEKDHGRSNHFK